MPFVHHLSMDINRKLASPALLVLIATGIYRRSIATCWASRGSAARS